MSGGYESSDRQVDELKPPPWRCDVHHLQVPDGDCPKCDAEQIALTEQAADPWPESVGHDAGVHVDLDTASVPATCKVWSDGVLIFDGVDRSALGEEGRQLASQRDDLIVQGADPADLDIPIGPVDWDSPTWGGGRHEAAWAPDGTHDDNAQDD